MSQRVKIDIYNPLGTTLLGTIDADTSGNGLLSARFTRSRNDVGDGNFTISLSHPDIGLVAFNNIAHIDVDNGTQVFAIEIRNIDVAHVGPSESAGMVMSASGPGVGILLGTSDVGGAVVYPGCGRLDTFRDGTRYFGWMSCCAFDHVANGFTTNPPMAHRQDNPEYPFAVTRPAGWLDGAAYRLFGSASGIDVPGTNEVQAIALGDSITAGSFTVSFNGETSAPVTSPWSALNVETALESLTTVDGVSVTGAGTNINPYMVTFDTGSVAGRNVPRIVVDAAALTHSPSTVTVDVVTEGKNGRYGTGTGRTYFHVDFTTTEELDLSLFVNMAFRDYVYLDGTPIYNQPAVAANTTNQIDFVLPAGDHCMTGRATMNKPPGLNGGMGWLMVSLATIIINDIGETELGDVILRTTPAWQYKFVTLEDPIPGLNVGEIVTRLVYEAQLLGDLPGVTLGFGTTLDSGGVIWDDDLVYGFPIGTGYVDAMGELADLAGITWEMSNDRVLSIWQDRGTTVPIIFKSGLETNDLTGGVLDTSYFGTPADATSFFIEAQDYMISDDGDPLVVAVQGSRRMGLTMGTVVNKFALNRFVRSARKRLRDKWSLVMRTWGPAGKVPMVDFDLEDIFRVEPSPIPGIVTERWKVIGIQMQWGLDADVDWTLNMVEVND